MRRIHVHSAKLARTLVLFSEQSVNGWALIESCPLITDFCEHLGFVDIGGQRVLAEFWVKSDERQEFLKLEGAIELLPEHPKQTPTFTGVAISRVPPDWFDSYRQLISNWLQINPYLVSNARFVTPEMIERAASLFTTARPLYDAEHALRDMDRQLARTAIFILLHQGRLCTGAFRKTADIAAMEPIAPTLAVRARRRTNRAARLDIDIVVITDETHHTLTGASQNSFDSIANLTFHAALGKARSVNYQAYRQRHTKCGRPEFTFVDSEDP
jgi:hypothetical protein